MTVGLGIAASQGCMAEPMDESEIGSNEEAVCANYSWGGTFASLVIAMGTETGEFHPTKYLVKQTNMWGNGRDGVKLTQAALDACNARGQSGCPKMSILLAMQDPAINLPVAQGGGGIATSIFASEDYRSNVVSKLQDQINYENSRIQNGQCLPPAHTLTPMGAPVLAECGWDYKFGVAFSGSGSEREAESYNSINLNGTVLNGKTFSWTASGGNMVIGPNQGDNKWLSNVPSTAPNMVYSMTFAAAGNYKVWVRGMATDGFSDSAYVGINNTTNMQILDFPENGSFGWVSGDISVPSAGTHNVHIFAREDGLNVDKLVVNQSSTPPVSGCNTPNDLKLRIDRFTVPNVNLRCDSTSCTGDPDPITDPEGGSGSGSAACGAVPTGGSDKLMIAYNADKEGDCCWNAYVQKTYKKYRTTYLLCS
jgi:hypothetical protein